MRSTNGRYVRVMFDASGGAREEDAKTIGGSFQPNLIGEGEWDPACEWPASTLFTQDQNREQSAPGDQAREALRLPLIAC